jgi:hypothetical protein
MAVPRRSGIETGRYESRNTYGKQIKDRRCQAAAEVFHPSGAALHAVRPASRRVSEIWYLSHLFPEARRSGLHSGRAEGQLVVSEETVSQSPGQSPEWGERSSTERTIKNESEDFTRGFR